MIDILKSFLITLAMAIAVVILLTLAYLFVCALPTEYAPLIITSLLLFLLIWLFVYCELYI